MAPRITGSANREKRKAQSSNRPITQGQNPQRSNRQGVSQATVSNGDSRTRTGTARVTSGQEPPKPVTRQSRVNGRLKPGTDTRPSPNTRASAKPAGPTPYQVSDPWAKPARASIGNVKGPASSPNRPAASAPASSSGSNGGGNTKPSAKPSGNFRAPSVPPAGSGAKPPVKGTPQAEAWLKEQLSARAKGTPLGARPLSSLVSQRGAGANAIVSAIAQAPEEIRRMSSGYYDLSKPNSERRANLTRALGSDPGSAAWNPFKSKPNTSASDPKPGTIGPALPKNNLATSVKGRPVGQQAVRNNKPVAWDGYKWVPSKSVGQVSVAKAPPAPKLPAASTTASRPSSNSGSGSRSSSGSSRPSIRSAASAPKKPQPGQSKDMNENYQMWAKANPALAAKVKSNQSGYNAFGKDAVAGVGPVKDGSSYKPQAEKTSEMNASAVRRAALQASASSVTDSKGTDTPKEKPKGTGSNFRTDIALLDKKKKK